MTSTHTTRESYSAALSTNDEQLDLCKLTVPEVRTGGIPASTDELKVGDKLYVVGANTAGNTYSIWRLGSGSP